MSVETKEPSCPICKRVGVPADPRTAPFCSDRCRQVDLFRWFGGKYAISSPITDPDVLEELLPDEGE